MTDTTIDRNYTDLNYSKDKISTYLEQVLSIRSGSCKDWLTNKVDRCVGGKVAKQQCAGPLQLPLNNCGVMALDYNGKRDCHFYRAFV
jgi:phosphoribosylformylglycinamidine synthase